MAYTPRDWTNVPLNEPPPAGAPALDAANLSRIEDGISAVHSEIDGRLSEASLSGTIATETQPIAEQSAAAYLASEPGVVDAAKQRATLEVQQAIEDEGSISDPVVASAIGTRGSSSRVAVAQAVAPLANRGALPGIFSLIAGTEDELASLIDGPAGSVTADTERARVSGQGWRQGRNGPGTLQMQFTQTVQVPPFQAVGFWFYVEDAANFSDVGIRMYFNSGFTADHRWTRALSGPPAQPLRDGWNFFRVPADYASAYGTITDWTTLYRWEVYAISSANFQGWTVGHLYLETPARSKTVIIADRGYTRFHQGLYQALKARGIPVTFAVDVTLFGTGTPGGATEAMTEAQIHAVAKENGNSISFHGYDGAPTATMTPAELRVDTAKSVKWLQRHGYAGRMWRAAYVQGAALPESHESVKPMLVGAASSSSLTGLTPWPPLDMHEIPRWSLDNTKTPAMITERFQQARESRMTNFLFVHSEGPAQFDYNTELREHFLAEIDQALAEGWIEPTTFEELFRQSGGLFRSTGGAHVAEYTDPSGERITRHVM